MKRFILVVSLGLMAVFGFAETESLLFNWGEPFDEKKLEKIDEENITFLKDIGKLENRTIAVGMKNIIGNENLITYFFSNDKGLEAIGFFEDSRNVYRLKSIMNFEKRQKGISSLHNFIKKINDYAESVNRSAKVELFFYSLDIAKDIANDVENNTTYRIDAIKEPGNIDVSIDVYNFDEKTRAYFIENLVDYETTVVIYIPKTGD